MTAYVDLPVAIVRQSRPKAVQVILDTRQTVGRSTIFWFARSTIRGGFDLAGGERDIVIQVADWVWAEKELEIRSFQDGDCIWASSCQDDAVLQEPLPLHEPELPADGLEATPW